jgi:hypothetical protein
MFLGGLLPSVLIHTRVYLYVCVLCAVHSDCSATYKKTRNAHVERQKTCGRSDTHTHKTHYFTRTRVRTHSYTHAREHTHIYTRTHTRTHTHTHTDIHTRTFVSLNFCQNVLHIDSRQVPLIFLPCNHPCINFLPTQGAGARRLAKFRCQAAVQLLLVQGCTDVYSRQYGYLPFVALSNILQVRLQGVFVSVCLCVGVCVGVWGWVGGCLVVGGCGGVRGGLQACGCGCWCCLACLLACVIAYMRVPACSVAY